MRDTGHRDGIGWGIIGCGDVVDRKAGRPLQEIEGSRIAAVMRRSADKARDFAGRHGVPFWTTEAKEITQHPEVDAIYVATPPDCQLEYALAARDAGKPCLVEKPAGRSFEETAAMVNAFRAAGLPFWVSYYRRHLPRFRQVRAVLESGRLGHIVSVSYHLSKKPRDGNWRLDPAVCGGGMFYDLAGHVLDLLDDWFGPLELTGSSATNVLPRHDAEDAVAMTFLTRDGAVGSASWDFAAERSRDELVIEGLHGRLSLEGMSRHAPLHLEIAPGSAVRQARSKGHRHLMKARAALGWPQRETFRFRDVVPHRPMLESIVAELRSGAPVGAGDAALRVSRLMNDAIDDYYGGRTGAFWDRPETWRSQRARAARRVASDDTPDYVLSEEELRSFDEKGYLGPFRCEGAWRQLAIPVKKGQNLHLEDPAVFDVCTHPSIVRRVSQLMRSPSISLFKSRFVVKAPGSGRAIAWHQDAGDRNGGFDAQNAPVPTVSAWLALDRVTTENGAMQVIAGTQSQLYGDFGKRIRANLVETGALGDEEISRATDLELEAGEFYIFHSWLLHGSEANRSALRRAGLNMRYAVERDERDPEAIYFRLRCPEAPPR